MNQCLYTIERCKKECEETAIKYGYPLTVPVERISSANAVAQVTYINDGFGGCIPSKIQFSDYFFSISNEDDCRQILLHEMAHYFVAIKTHEHHGHDKVFQEVCESIGCTKMFADEENISYVMPRLIVCSKCGKILGETIKENAPGSSRWVTACCHASIKLIEKPEFTKIGL